MTSSSMMAPVTEARRLNLPSILGVAIPSRALEDEAADRPAVELGQITNTSAIGELVIHIFEPESL